MGALGWILGLLLSPWVFVPLIYPGLVSAFAVLLFIIWFERKLAAKVQRRFGPYYVLRHLGGATQLVADLIRYLFAEPIIPEEADALAFVMGPALLFGLTLLPVVAIPVSGTFYAIRSDVSLLIVLALLTLGAAMTLIIGWAGNNKFSLIGGLREGFLSMAYEIPLFVAALSMAAAYGTLDLVDMVEVQAETAWGVALNPLAAFVFLVISFLATSRFPFEISEAESELVMGPFTEYSGIMYGLTMGASYLKYYVLCLLFSIMFLGGWEPVPPQLAAVPFGPGVVVFAKALALMALGVFLRAVYPRYRVDQAIRLAWHYLLPLSVASVFVSMGAAWLGLTGA